MAGPAGQQVLKPREIVVEAADGILERARCSRNNGEMDVIGHKAVPD
jgi:hypothetical protein